MAKPTILIFPGAYHKFVAVDSFVARATAAGYPTAGQGLVSVGDASKNLSDDVAMMTTHFQRLIEDEGRDVVAVFHSYAGCPGGTAVAGWSKPERAAAGKAGGLIGIVWLAAFIPRVGESIVTLVKGDEATWSTADPATGLVTVTSDPIPVFYRDVPADTAAALCKELLPHSIQAFLEVTQSEGYSAPGFNGRRSYIYCRDDQAVHLPKQQSMVNHGPESWLTRLLVSDHSPFVSHPDELLRALEELMAEWAKA